MKEWILVKDLVGVGGLAGTPQGVAQRAKKENWQRRRVAGMKGNVFEYNVQSMPVSVQQALGIKVEQEGMTWHEDDFDYISDLSVTEQGVESKRFAFAKSWLKKMAINIAHTAFFKMPDDGMERTIYKGDRVLVTIFFHKQSNKTERGLSTHEELWKLQDGLYVIRINNRLTIRRIQFDLQKGIFVTCDNPLYRELHLATEQIDPTIIIGQVHWYAHTVQWD